MDKRNAGKSWTHSGTVFVALLAILGLVTSCSGSSVPVGTSPSGGSPIPPPTPVQPSIGSIASVVTAAVNTPYLSGNAVQYYCDCTGAGQSCAVAGVIQGSNSTGNGTQGNPYQTIGAAITYLNGGNNRTAVLCKGGSFPTATTLTFTNTTCAVGSICNELREYQGGVVTNAKPIIDGTTAPTGCTAGNCNLFSSAQNVTNGGWRFMNIKLQGPGAANSVGMYLYTYTGGTYVHDITIENVDIDGFQNGIDQENPVNNNITITGNHFTNNIRWAYLGSSNNLNLNYNSFINNGSTVTYDHSIYLATNYTASITNVNIIGNYISGYYSTGTKCVGEPLVAHAAVTNLVVSGNVIIEPTNSDPQCYGMSFDNTGGPTNYAWYRNAIFSDNIIINVGNIGMQISNCPYCVIENNLLISEGSVTLVGIVSPNNPANTGYNDVGTNVKMVNNTAYFGVNHTTGIYAGFEISTEGVGHVIANNTVAYEATTGSVSCYKIVPTVTIGFMNNNNCFSKASSNYWMNNNNTFSSLASWQISSGFDSASSYADPGWSFATPFSIPIWNDNLTPWQWIGTSFIPTGTVLPAKGNHTYAPATDITNTARPAIPSIGAFE